VLATVDGVSAWEQERAVLVRLDGEPTAAQVNAALVSAGVAVSALVPEHESLEDVFVSLVEGDGVRG
jgi:hypothetical protein